MTFLRLGTTRPQKQATPPTNEWCVFVGERASEPYCYTRPDSITWVNTNYEEAMRVPLRKVDEIEPRSWVACCAWLQEKGPVRDITVVRI